MMFIYSEECFNVCACGNSVTTSYEEFECSYIIFNV